MKSINIFTILLIFILSSCNNDVKIVEYKNNIECKRLVTLFKHEIFFNETVGREADSTDLYGVFKHYDFMRPKSYNFEKDISDKIEIKNNENIEILSRTKNLAIKNFSETKVYNVRIKRTCKDKIKYKDYKIEPKEQICIGCESDFDVNFKHHDAYFNSAFALHSALRNNSYEGLIKKTYKVEYEIHDVTVLSEY
jgi:hypothetical protein